MSDSDEAVTMVAITHFANSLEAELLASTLVAHGIEAEVEPHAAYDTLSHLQVGLNPQGIAVLVPARHRQEARDILRKVKTGAAQEIDVRLTIQTCCRRALFLSVCATMIVGPFAMLMLFHIRKLKKALAAEKERLDEKRYARCAGYLAAATLISFASGVLGFCCIVSVGTTVSLVGT